MGNCLQQESATQWGGDDWSFSPVPDAAANTRQLGKNRGSSIFESTDHDKGNDGEENLLLGSSLTSTTTAATEVKIKISKKQLEELLGNLDLKALSVQQVLSRLVAVSSDQFEAADQRSWRPNLQSIPE